MFLKGFLLLRLNLKLIKVFKIKKLFTLHQHLFVTVFYQ